MINISRTQLDEVRNAIENRNRSYVRVNHIDDYLDMTGEEIGTALTRLEDMDELELYNRSSRGKLYRVD